MKCPYNVIINQVEQTRFEYDNGEQTIAETVTQPIYSESDILLKRLKHLLESEVISGYDEVDPFTGEYKKDIQELDAIVGSMP